MEVGRDWDTIMLLGEGTPRQSENKNTLDVEKYSYNKGLSLKSS